MTTNSPTIIDHDLGHPHSGVAIVTHDLDQLGIGQYWVQTGKQNGRQVIGRRIPPGHGWCQALHLPRALWPASADLCVEVDWHHDEDIATAELDQHWRTRLAAVTAGLEGLGYAVRMPGPRRTPGRHRDQPLIVSRHPDGTSPAPVPGDGWDHLPVHPSYRWPARAPGQHLETILEDARLTGYATRSLGTHLWPAYATAATTVLWSGGTNTTVDDWDSAMARLRRLLHITGYKFLDHGRPWNPSIDHRPYLIAYRRDRLRTDDRS